MVQTSESQVSFHRFVDDVVRFLQSKSPSRFVFVSINDKFISKTEYINIVSEAFVFWLVAGFFPSGSSSS